MVIEEATCELLGNDGGKYSLVGEMVLDSDADSLYRMLVDYEASPRIFATVDSCAVDALPDGRLLVRQSCRWKFMVFGGAFPCQLAVLELPATGNGGDGIGVRRVRVGDEISQEVFSLQQKEFVVKTEGDGRIFTSIHISTRLSIFCTRLFVAF